LRSISKLLALQVFALALAVPIASLAQSNCPTRETSIFGTVRAVNAYELTLESNSRMGAIHVFTRGARLNTNGLALRPGVFAGVYGCLEPADQSFRASEVTLAASPSAYEGGGRHYTSTDTWVEGRIDNMRPGAVLIDSGHGHGDTWVETPAQGLRRGQLIQAVGRFAPGDRQFIASSVVVLQQ
jgi:hypothetical protein